MFETVHLHPSRLRANASVFLVLIPAIVFLLTLVLFSVGRKEEVATGSVQTEVLGTESEK